MVKISLYLVTNRLREDRIGAAFPAWPSDIVSSEVPGSFPGFSARSMQSPFFHFFGNVIKALLAFRKSLKKTPSSAIEKWGSFYPVHKPHPCSINIRAGRISAG
jgi:hypothetical protein